MVYEDAEKIYSEVKKEGNAMLNDALGSLLQSSFCIPDGTFSMSSAGSIVALNTTMFPRLDVVKVPLGGSGGSKLKSKVVQTSKDGSYGYMLMQAEKGLGLSFSRGLFADCNPAIGRSCIKHLYIPSFNVLLSQLRCNTLDTSSSEILLSK